MHKRLLIKFAYFVLIGTSFNATAHRYFDVQNVKANDTLNLRRSQDFKSDKLGELPHDAQCVVEIQRKDNWSLVLFGGHIGWAKNNYLTKNDSPKCIAEEIKDGYYLYDGKCVDIVYSSQTQFYGVSNGELIHFDKAKAKRDDKQQCSSSKKGRNLLFFPTDHRHFVDSVAVNRPKKILASLDQNNYLVLRNIDNKKIVYSAKLNAQCGQISWSSSGEVLTCQKESELYLFDFKKTGYFLKQSNLPTKYFAPYNNPKYSDGFIYTKLFKDYIYAEGIGSDTGGIEGIGLGRKIVKNGKVIFNDEGGVMYGIGQLSNYQNKVYFADRISSAPLTELDLVSKSTWTSHTQAQVGICTGCNGAYLGNVDGKIIFTSELDKDSEFFTLSLTNLSIEKIQPQKRLNHQGYDGNHTFLKLKNGVVINYDGEYFTFTNKKGELLAQATIFKNGNYIFFTPEGYFYTPNLDLNASVKIFNFNANQKLNYDLEQLADVFYRPDLVMEKIAGDSNGKVANARKKLNLDILVDSGKPPEIAFFSPQNNSKIDTSEVKVVAKIHDEGGGRGRVEWRVNGVTQKVYSVNLEPIKGQVSSKLNLQPGKNIIELVIYNQANLVASKPQQLALEYTGQARAKPTLHIFAIGVNNYQGGLNRLNFAIADVDAIVRDFKTAGSPLFSNVSITSLVDEKVTKQEIDKVFKKLSLQVKPQDSFVFFISGHGKTHEGRYYYIPQNFKGGISSLKKQGIGQSQWQSWFASVPALNSLLLYDTCESGTLTQSGAYLEQSKGLEQQSAMTRLNRAFGRTILSATTGDLPALEGYKGHGVFTYGLINALREGDKNSDSRINVIELANFVEKNVPKYSKAAWRIEQKPQKNISGENFTIGNVLKK